MKNLNILTTPTTIDNYPYGRLKCKMTFSIEFNKGKGYRNVMQSINPKTGRLNAPKKSTYSHFQFMYLEESTGHIKFGGMMITGFEAVAKLIELLSNNNFTFTPEQSQELWATIITAIKISATYTKVLDGVSIDELLESTKVKEMIKLYGNKTDLNEIKKVGYSIETIKAVKIY